jgi:quercetin dioxygenase-like cupin family protein
MKARTEEREMSTAQPIVTADNDQVRVTTLTFGAEGATTGPHRHELDYVVVPVTGGSFLVTETDGSLREMTQVPGAPYLGSAGTAHSVANVPGQEAVFVEIELKR